MKRIREAQHDVTRRNAKRNDATRQQARASPLRATSSRRQDRDWLPNGAPTVDDGKCVVAVARHEDEHRHLRLAARRLNSFGLVFAVVDVPNCRRRRRRRRRRLTPIDRCSSS